MRAAHGTPPLTVRPEVEGIRGDIVAQGRRAVCHPEHGDDRGCRRRMFDNHIINLDDASGFLVRRAILRGHREAHVDALSLIPL